MLAHLLLLAGLVPGADPVRPGVKTDAQNIQGTWEVIQFLSDDSPRTKEKKKESKEKTWLLIDGRNLRFVEGKKGEYPQPYQLHSEKKPKGITFGFVSEKGLYELNGDDLKLCLPTGDSNEVKLKSIPEKATKGVMVIVLKRRKPIELKDLVLPNQIAKSVREVLDKAEQIELLSLDPDRKKKPAAGGGFHGYEVLGKTVIKDKKDRQKLLQAFYEGVADSTGAAGCFNPRHGIRAQHDGKTTELVICFECLSLLVYGPDKYKGNLLTEGSPSTTFNQFLRKAKVPLPKE